MLKVRQESGNCKWQLALPSTVTEIQKYQFACCYCFLVDRNCQPIKKNEIKSCMYSDYSYTTVG